MAFPANAREAFSVQAPAYGHEQFSNAQPVTEALAFPQPPVKHAYYALVAAAERTPDDMPESQLPTDRSQLCPRDLQQLFAQLRLQQLTRGVVAAEFDFLCQATPTEDRQAFIKHLEDSPTMLSLVRIRQTKFRVGDHL